jgi:lipopolysaccharide transport system ATP-binding protein
MEYEVLKGGHVLLPNFWLHNGDAGVCAFGMQDLDPEWRRKPRPPGRYLSAVSIPGNLLSEGMMLVDARMNTVEPIIQQFAEGHTVAFQVVDSLDGDSARGDWAGPMGGAVRPKLEWTTCRISGRTPVDDSLIINV